MKKTLLVAALAVATFVSGSYAFAQNGTDAASGTAKVTRHKMKKKIKKHIRHHHKKVKAADDAAK